LFYGDVELQLLWFGSDFLTKVFFQLSLFVSLLFHPNHPGVLTQGCEQRGVLIRAMNYDVTESFNTEFLLAGNEAKGLKKTLK